MDWVVILMGLLYIGSQIKKNGSHRSECNLFYLSKMKNIFSRASALLPFALSKNIPSFVNAGNCVIRLIQFVSPQTSIYKPASAFAGAGFIVSGEAV